MVSEQFMEYFGMEDSDSEPTKNIPTYSRSLTDRSRAMFTMLEEFMSHYGYLEIADNNTSSKTQTDDTVYNYSCNLCHWVVQLILMEDIVKEGDITRLVPSVMYSLQFFFSHSRLSKYFQECLDLVLKSEYILSPLQRVRVLEGAFTNLRGGRGNNIESDLVQENSVRNQKDLIRALGANKTDKAIMRSTKAAGSVDDICGKVDLATALHKASSRHHTPRSEKDEKVIHKSLRDLRPFSKTPGRVCEGLPKILSSPLKKIKMEDFKYRIMQVVQRLYYGQTFNNGDNSSDEDD